MVREVRTILMNEEEVRRALTSYRRLHSDFLPGGNIRHCRGHDNVEAVAIIETRCAGMTKEMDFTLSASVLLDPLIHFCIENNILLPRRGRKSVIFEDGLPALYVEMDSYVAGGFEA